MRSAKLLALLIGCALAGSAAAETVVVDGQVRLEQTSVAKPGRGTTMRQVQAKFGAPAKRYPAVGKSRAFCTPPRWAGQGATHASHG